MRYQQCDGAPTDVCTLMQPVLYVYMVCQWWSGWDDHLGLAKNVHWHNVSTSLHRHVHKALALGQVHPFSVPEHRHGERKSFDSTAMAG